MGDVFYKVLDKNGYAFHGGTGQWKLPRGSRPGGWMPPIKNPKPCVRGYHLCRPGDLIDWLGPRIWLAEYRGELVADNNKVVVSEARLISATPWDERTAKLFAADCAERVLPFFEKQRPNDDRPRLSIQAARDYANGLVNSAAEAAAEAAAWAAARDAARDAAWDAAPAARAAARAAAWDAAWDAARAAWAAARDAETKWQTRRLFGYLDGKRG